MAITKKRTSVKVAPSILAADFSKLEEQIRLAEAGSADWIHIDVMDGHFVPNLTFGPIMVSAVNRLTDLPLDVHLMIDDAGFFLEDFVKAGADNIIVHYEAVVHLNNIVNRIKALGAKAGVAINPSTPTDVLKDIIEDVDQIPPYVGESGVRRTEIHRFGISQATRDQSTGPQREEDRDRS